MAGGEREVSIGILASDARWLAGGRLASVTDLRHVGSTVKAAPSAGGSIWLG